MSLVYARRGMAGMLNFTRNQSPLAAFVPQSDQAQLLGLVALFSLGAVVTPKAEATEPFIDAQSKFVLFMDEESLLDTFIGGQSEFEIEISRDALMASLRITRSTKDG